MTFAISAIRGLDHIDLRVRDIMSEWTGWQKLGFSITPPSYNNLEGIASCAVALADGMYVTMSGPVEDVNAHRSAVEAGVNAALLRVDNRDKAVEEMQKAGLPIKAVFGFSRHVEIDGKQATITFRLASVDTSDSSNDIDEIMIIEHVTPHHIWRDEMMQHSNGVQGLHKVVLSCNNPLALEDIYSRILGADKVSQTAGGGLDIDCGNAIISYVPRQGTMPAGHRPGILNFYGAQNATEADLPGQAGRTVITTSSLSSLVPAIRTIGPPRSTAVSFDRNEVIDTTGSKVPGGTRLCSRPE